MPHEQYTGGEKEELINSRAVFRTTRPDMFDRQSQSEAEMENEFRDLLKKREIEIPDIERIRTVEIGQGGDREGSIMITTVNQRVYVVWPATLKGKYFEPAVDVKRATTNEEIAQGYEIGDPTNVTISYAPDGADWKRMERSEVERFVGKYQPNLLAELYLQAKYNAERKKDGYKEEYRGDLSW